MQLLEKPKTLKSEGIPTAKALAVIDLGNGQVKALIREHGSNKFERVSFPSYVAETQESHSDCLKIYGDRCSLMSYLLTEVADRERLANQARTISLASWAASIALIGFALVPSVRQNPFAKSVIIFAACGLTAVSRT